MEKKIGCSNELVYAFELFNASHVYNWNNDVIKLTEYILHMF